MRPAFICSLIVLSLKTMLMFRSSQGRLTSENERDTRLAASKSGVAVSCRALIRKPDCIGGDGLPVYNAPVFALRREATVGTPVISAVCRLCKVQHASAKCARLQQIETALELLGVPAYVTDTFNCFVRVNREFARMIGDPVAENIPVEQRFIHSLVIGPWRERFERPSELVANCLPSLVNEIDAGRLSPLTRALVDRTLSMDPGVRRALCSPRKTWNGGVVVTPGKHSSVSVREQVSPVLDAAGQSTGFHISLWFPVDLPVTESLSSPAVSRAATSALTPRQLELACWFAEGLDYKEVALMAGVTPATARSHLEEIYNRLGVHSRAKMVALLVKSGAV